MGVKYWCDRCEKQVEEERDLNTISLTKRHSTYATHTQLWHFVDGKSKQLSLSLCNDCTNKFGKTAAPEDATPLTAEDHFRNFIEEVIEDNREGD